MTACIRRAALTDRDTLSRLSEETFRQSFIEDFAIPYPQEDLAVYVPRTYGVQAWTSTLSDPACATWIAQAAGGEGLGYATAGPCTLPYPQADPAHGELKRLYLRREAQGRGLGRRLMEEALAWLEREGRRPVWIGVWSGNLRAQRFYARYGFENSASTNSPSARGAIRSSPCGERERPRRLAAMD